MSRIGLSPEQLDRAERKRDAVMIEMLLDLGEEKIEAAKVLTLNRLYQRVVLGHALCESKRAWVEGIIASCGLARDVGAPEDYAERTYAPVARGIDADWRMGPKVLAPPPSSRRRT